VPKKISGPTTFFVNTGALRNNETIVTNKTLRFTIESFRRDPESEIRLRNRALDLMAIDFIPLWYNYRTNDELLGNIFANFIGK
jgi:tRNA modification GTPase